MAPPGLIFGQICAPRSPNNPTTPQPYNPATQQPNNPTTPQPHQPNRLGPAECAKRLNKSAALPAAQRRVEPLSPRPLARVSDFSQSLRHKNCVSRGPQPSPTDPGGHKPGLRRAPGCSNREPESREMEPESRQRQSEPLFFTTPA